MGSVETEVERSTTSQLVGALRSGELRPGIGRAEQRYWLSEAAFELVDRQGPRALGEMLASELLPADSRAAIVEAVAPALGESPFRVVVVKYLSEDDDHLVATALRALAVARLDGEVLVRARALLAHRSPIVRMAALAVLSRSVTTDFDALLMKALNDPDRSVREAALDLADDLAAAGVLRAAQCRAVLEAAERDDDISIREFASELQSLNEAAATACSE